MSLVDAHIEIVPRYTWLGQECENVFRYFTEGAVFVGVNAVQVAEAWWNDIKTDFRALMVANTGYGRFTSVFCRNLVDGGEYGEFAIPLLEQVGTRSASGLDTAVPSFTASGVRFTVGNTSTRPGQKRFPFLFNADAVDNVLEPAMFTLVDTLAAHLDSPVTLGAPVALGVLQPIIGGTVVDGFPTVYQDVVGHITNPNTTSQVSRKLGRGR